MTTVCITGAAGNLGGLTARHLFENTDFQLHLMLHHKPLSPGLGPSPRLNTFHCDLAHPRSLDACLHGVDEIVHYAGILFKANPEKFLPTTNTVYFQNLVDAAKRQGVRRITLISFPHVEGPTSPTDPSTDRLDRMPVSAHARTRLEEERILQREYPDSVVLRVGMVYGRGILMPDAARWFARRRLLGVWKQPTPIHLISKHDFLASVHATLANPSLRGTHNIGDEGHQTLQEFLDFCCQRWNCPRPWRMPLWLIRTAARLFEAFSWATGSQSPLTRDFIEIGRVPYWGDTTSMRSQILPVLRYRTLRDGQETL